MNNIYIQGELVGSHEGGDGFNPFIVTFNENASADDVAIVMRHINYSNISDNLSTETRTVSFGLTDGDGGTSQEQFKDVRIFSVNDVPDIMFSSDGVTVSSGNEILLGESLGLFIADADDPNDFMEVRLKVRKGALNFTSDLSDLTSIIFDVDIDPEDPGLARLIFSGTVQELNIALSRLTYMSNDGFTGTDSFYFSVKDFGTSSTLAGTQSDWEVFDIHVV